MCLVRTYQDDVRKETNRQCRECYIDSFRQQGGWTTTDRDQRFSKTFHRHLCSCECFEFFHTHTARGLDYVQRRQRQKVQKSAGRQNKKTMVGRCRQLLEHLHTLTGRQTRESDAVSSSTFSM